MRPINAFLILLAGAPLLPAQETPNLKELLSERIIDTQQTLHDTQKFLLPKIPVVPEFKSIKDWEQYTTKLRADVLEKVVYRGEAAEWRDAKTKVVWLQTIPGGPGYQIKKLRYEALPGLWIPAVLYEPLELNGKVPVALNVMGHDRGGKDVAYQQIRCINLVKRGMLALNVEWFNFGQLNNAGYHHGRMNQLNLCGTSGLAPFYLSLKRGLDVLLHHPNADPKRVAVSGLSGGGWQTIYISALDTRVTLTNPVAGYSSFRTRLKHFKDLGDSEQTPCDMATIADYDHLTAMMAPRATLLTFNATDQCCFEAGYALPPLMKAAGPFFKMYGKTNSLRQHINKDPGTHNYEIDNRQAFYQIIGDHFFPNDKDYPRDEIPCMKEIKTPAELAVSMPKQNENFNTLALKLSENLPVAAQQLKNKAKARARLVELLRGKRYLVMAKRMKRTMQKDLQVTYWELHVGDDWTVPVVEFKRGKPKQTTIVMHDNGRINAVNTIDQLLKKGQRILAVDPWYIGKCGFTSHAYLFALLVDATGERPLGIQASQLSAVTRWAAKEFKNERVQLNTVGPRSCVIGLVAAAMEPNATGKVSLEQPLKSLRDIIRKNHTYNEMPELFCFGLLKEFDMTQLAVLAESNSE